MRRANLLDELLLREKRLVYDSTRAIYETIANDIYSAFLYTVREIDRTARGNKTVQQFSTKFYQNLKQRMQLSYLDLGGDSSINAYSVFDTPDVKLELPLVLSRMEEEIKKIKTLKASVFYLRTPYLTSIEETFLKLSLELSAECTET